MTLYGDLQTLGLTANQSQVYLTLARAGQLKAGEVIKRTGLHRNLVYTALQGLSERKLVSASCIKGVAVYKLLVPTRLLDEPQEKERLAKRVVEELGVLSKKHSSGQEIVVYEGVDEFRRYEMRSYAAMKPNGLIRYLGISPRWHEIMGPSVEHDLIATQIAKNIQLKALANEIAPEQREYVRKTHGLTEVRLHPLISGDTSGVRILDDRLSIRSFIEPFFVVEIIQKELAKNYQNYFDFLWKQRVSR